MVVVTRAGRLREWSKGELRLYTQLIKCRVFSGLIDFHFKTVSSSLSVVE